MVVICLDTVVKDKEVSKEDFCKQWDDLMNMAKTQTGTFEVQLKSDKLSVSLEIDPKTLYVVSKNAAISYSIIPVDTEVKITMINLIDAINNLIKNGEHADKKCKALAVSPSARPRASHCSEVFCIGRHRAWNSLGTRSFRCSACGKKSAKNQELQK